MRRNSAFALPEVSGAQVPELRSAAEPNLSPILQLILGSAQQELATKSSTSLGSDFTSEELFAIVESQSEKHGYELSSFERDEVLRNLERSQQPFGVLQELIDDPSISDIIVRSADFVAVQKGRENLRTSFRFPNQEIYEAFVERLLQRAGTSYSTKKPIADGMIGEDVRLHAVHKSICESGPYLTLRVNRFSQVTIDKLTEFGLAPQEVLDYLASCIYAGKTILIVGEVGTGKTTLTRAVSSVIPESDSILVIEDTPEIRLEHPHVRYLTTRESNIDGEGRISPAECIRAGMRMAMNRIIFGEMRDAEAAESFIDVCASGHPGVSTLHAKSASEAITRLELFLGRAQPGVTRDVIMEQIATAVQAIVFIDLCRHTRKRRIKEVIEVSGSAEGRVKQREIFKYRVIEGIPYWQIANRVSSFQEDFDYHNLDYRLGSLPSALELSEEVALRESAEAQSVS